MRHVNPRTMMVADVLAVLWVGAWVLLGLWVADEVEGLRALGVSVSEAGSAVEQTGRSLGGIDVPFVGDSLSQAADRITRSGRDVRTSGLEARESIADLSTLLGLSVALIPSSFLLIAYVPMRVAFLREGRALRRLLHRAGDDPELDRLLAARFQRRNLQALEALDGRPWAGSADEHARLAAAECRRFGVERRGH